MAAPQTTTLYAALLAVIFLYLSARVALLRWRRNEYSGERDPSIWGPVRAHANFSENVPLALILMAFAEMMGAPVSFLHGLGAVLVSARALHAFGVSRAPEPIWLRVVGFTLTCAVIGMAACVAAYLSFMRI